MLLLIAAIGAWFTVGLVASLLLGRAIFNHQREP
jgi:hypothetical protein